MGSLILPPTGLIYVDSQIAIYSADGHPKYGPPCAPIWQVEGPRVVSSELVLLETLVAPIRDADQDLQSRRETLWRQVNTVLLPITRDILKEAARLRATLTSLRTPDAIHAATALQNNCALFVTNDQGFRRIPGLNTIILDDVLALP